VFGAQPANNPFAPYVVSLSAAVYNPNGSLALTATASADNTLAGFPAGNISNNTVQGAPQLAEFEAFSN
jgi:hypothetical protein